MESLFITGTNWWGSAEGIYISSIPEGYLAEDITLGGIHNIRFEDVTVLAENTALISSKNQAVGLVSEISFKNV